MKDSLCFFRLEKAKLIKGTKTTLFRESLNRMRQFIVVTQWTQHLRHSKLKQGRFKLDVRGKCLCKGNRS